MLSWSFAPSSSRLYCIHCKLSSKKASKWKARLDIVHPRLSSVTQGGWRHKLETVLVRSLRLQAEAHGTSQTFEILILEQGRWSPAKILPQQQTATHCHWHYHLWTLASVPADSWFCSSNHTSSTAVEGKIWLAVLSSQRCSYGCHGAGRGTVGFLLGSVLLPTCFEDVLQTCNVFTCWPRPTDPSL